MQNVGTLIIGIQASRMIYNALKDEKRERGKLSGETYETNTRILRFMYGIITAPRLLD